MLADRRVTNLCNRVDLGGVGDALRVRAITRLIFIGHRLPVDQIMELPARIELATARLQIGCSTD